MFFGIVQFSAEPREAEEPRALQLVVLSPGNNCITGTRLKGSRTNLSQASWPPIPPNQEKEGDKALLKQVTKAMGRY